MALKIKPNNRENINKQKAIEEISKDRMVKLTVNLPKSMQIAFKVATTRDGTNMTDEVLRFVKEYIRM